LADVPRRGFCRVGSRASWAAAKIYLKREDLLHNTGAHKINNAWPILLGQRMGTTRIIAETARASTV